MTAQDARDGRTDPGEGSALDAAIEAGQGAAEDTATGGVINGPYTFAEPGSGCVFPPWAPGRREIRIGMPPGWPKEIAHVVVIAEAEYERLIAERDAANARIAELERQRDQVMAIVGRQPIDARRAYADIRAIYGGGQ